VKNRIVIGTRQSELATWQAEFVANQLRTLCPTIEVVLQFFVTQGDRTLDKPLPEIGGKGVFTAELEAALLNHEIDLAVHSLKDLPTDLSAEFSVGAIPQRASPYDVLVSRSNASLADLPEGATVGTSSLRRVAQLKAYRPDLRTESLRGNVPTRVKKAKSHDGPYDAIILAEAGLDRLGLAGEITEVLAPEIMLPAPAQGALAVQCRADDMEIQTLLVPLDDTMTRFAVEAERAFLNALDAGCRLPVAALATLDQKSLYLTGRVSSLDGTKTITVRDDAVIDNRQQSVEVGKRLAERALREGAGDLLDAIRRGLPA
jgi:hydroxymethylbilane synthase